MGNILLDKVVYKNRHWEKMKYINKAFGMLVPNIQEVIHFYRDILGYSVVRESESFITFDAGGKTLFMWEWDHINKHIGSENMKKVQHKNLFAILFKNRQEVDLAYKELLNQGVDLVRKPQYWPDWKSYAGYFIDPNGYMWEIWCWTE